MLYDKSGVVLFSSFRILKGWYGEGFYANTITDLLLSLVQRQIEVFLVGLKECESKKEMSTNQWYGLKNQKGLGWVIAQTVRYNLGQLTSYSPTPNM